MRAIALAVAVAFGILIGQGFGAAYSKADQNIERQLGRLIRVMELILSHYVDQLEIEELAEAAISGMLTSLDRNSSYIDARTFQEMQVEKKGKFGGVGIEGIMDNGNVKVIAPMDCSPAARAGIRANDLIVKIDGSNVEGMTMFEVADRMRGPINSPIKLTLLREGQGPMDLQLVREEIRVRSVKWNVEGTDDDIAYIRISSFTEETQQGLEDAVASLKKRLAGKLKGYVIDLRNNPGGLLDQAVLVSDAFLDRGELVSTRGRRAVHTRHFDAQVGDLSDGKPLLVLINGGSASGSEVVAGALQDNGRALVIGTRSFGKGTVQTIVPLGELGAVKLTTARFYTPSGRSIEERGIDPDLTIEQDVTSKPLGENTPGSSLEIKTKTAEQARDCGVSHKDVAAVDGEDLQLKAAVDVLHGVKVPNTKPKEATPTEGAGERANNAN